MSSMSRQEFNQHILKMLRGEIKSKPHCFWLRSHDWSYEGLTDDPPRTWRRCLYCGQVEQLYSEEVRA